MSFLPKNESTGDKKGPSTNRVILWVVMGGIGLYLLASGIIGILGG